MSDKIKILEALRGWAALMVVLFHASAFNSALVQNTLIRHGDLFVDFFFCLSGFVISLSYLDRLSSTADLIAFQTKRFLRLYPLHITVLLAFVGVEVAKLLVETRLGLTLQKPAFSANDLSSFLNNLFLTHGLFEEALTWNHPSWSISVEFFTYLAFAALMVFVSGPRTRLCLFLVCITAAGTTVWLSDNTMATTGMVAFARCLYCFFLGATLYVLCPSAKAVRHATSIGVVATLAAVYFSDHLPYPIIPLVFTATIWAAVTDADVGLKRILSGRSFVYLGTISYGIYLWHMLVWLVIINILTYVIKVPVQIDGTFDLAPSTTLILLGLGIAVTLALAHASYWLIERPALRYGPKLIRPEPKRPKGEPATA